MPFAKDSEKDNGMSPVEGGFSRDGSTSERVPPTFRVANAAAVAARYALLVILLALFVTAVSRWLHVGNTHWLSDVAKLGLFGTTVLGAGRVAALGDNIAFSLLRNSPEGVQVAAKLVVHGVTLLIALMMLYFGVVSTWNVRAVTSSTLHVSRAWFMGLLPLAFALVAIVEVGHVTGILRQLRDRDVGA